MRSVAGAGSDETVAPGGAAGVLVVDDHRAYAEAISLALSAHLTGGRPVATAHTIDDALAHVAAQPTDVVLLDWQIEGEDGLDGARLLRSLASPPHVIIVTAHCTPALQRMAQATGACAALSKHAPIASLVDAIERCRTGSEAEWSVAEADDDVPVLSARQIEVLWLLSTGADVRSIAATLFLSVETVRTYLKDALRRLGAHSQMEAVAIARRAGLVPPDPTQSPPT